MKLLIFDTETTGKDNPRCIQFAYKRIDAKTMKVEGSKSFMCKPPVPIEIGAMAVHHITNEMVDDHEWFEAYKVPVQSLVNTCVLIAHNAKFDIGVLKNEGVDVSKVKHICTYKLAVHLYPDFENHQLQYLRYALKGVDRPEFHDLKAHDAMADVIILEHVFYSILWTFIERDKKKEYDESDIPRYLEEMAAMSAKPILLPKFTFGKFKGKTFEEVKLRDRSYFDWLLDSETRKPTAEQNENLVYTLRHYIG